MTNDIEVWPGRPYPLGATYDGTGTNFSLFSEVAERVELCLFDDDGDETRVDLPEVDGLCWHGYLPGVGTGSATASGCTARGTRPRASAATRPSCCSTPTPRPSRARSTGTRPCFAYDFGDPDSRNDDDSAPHVPKAVVVSPYFDWGDDRPPDVPLARDGHLRGPRQGLHGHATPTSPSRCGAPTPAWPTRRPSTTCSRLGVTAVELHAGPPVRARRPPRRAGPAQLLGLQLDRLLRPAQRVRARRAPTGSRCRSSSRWCGRCTRPASR